MQSSSEESQVEVEMPFQAGEDCGLSKWNQA